MTKLLCKIETRIELTKW